MSQDPFYIWFERSGGFTGISTTVEIDSKALPDEELEKLKQLIDQSGLYEFQKSDSLSGNVPDQYQYKITIECEGEKQTVELSESSVPEGFRPLINYLTQKARAKKRE